MRDKSKPPYFPSVPLTVPDWIWGFSSSFSSFSFPCLPLRPLRITWNQAVSQLDDAVSFMRVEGDSRQPRPLVLLTHFKSAASVVCVQQWSIPKSIKDPVLWISMHANVQISFADFNVQNWLIFKEKCWSAFKNCLSLKFRFPLFLNNFVGSWFKYVIYPFTAQCERWWEKPLDHIKH